MGPGQQAANFAELVVFVLQHRRDIAVIDLHEAQPVDSLHFFEQAAEGLEVHFSAGGSVAEEILAAADDGCEAGRHVGLQVGEDCLVGQVVHFDLDKPVDPCRFQNSLNALLPPDVRIMKLQKAKDDFHARFSATGKEYRYFVWNGPAVPPELRLYRLHERRSLNMDAMRGAGEQLVGTHDFAAFTANPNREIAGTVKTVTRITVTRSRAGDVKICIAGEGFLYKMVRSIAGFLLRVGVGELTAEDAKRLLLAGKRTNEVPTAKPYGLFLWRVDYRLRTKSQ